MWRLPRHPMQERYSYDTEFLRAFARESGCDRVKFFVCWLRISSYFLFSILNYEEAIFTYLQPGDFASIDFSFSYSRRLFPAFIPSACMTLKMCWTKISQFAGVWHSV